MRIFGREFRRRDSFLSNFLSDYISLMDFREVAVELIFSCRSKYLVAQGPSELMFYSPRYYFTMALELGPPNDICPNSSNRYRSIKYRMIRQAINWA